jgi:hypothetical protein
MTEQTVDAGLVEKIKKILAKAESTNSPEEASIFYAKAEEMMQRHMIDEAMLAALGTGKQDTIGMMHVPMGKTYWLAWRTVLVNLGYAFGFKVLIGDNRKGGTIVWFGWQSELKTAEVMVAHLEIQAERAAAPFMSNYTSPYTDTAKAREDRFKAKRSFLEGYGCMVARRIETQRAMTRNQVSREKGESSGNLLPVLVSRDDQLQSAFDDLHTKKANLKQTQLNATGYGAGREAGRSADINNPRLGSSSRGALNS